jgi:hypothetical protein
VRKSAALYLSKRKCGIVNECVGGEVTECARKRLGDLVGERVGL